ncbi:uncharacterized protein BDV17DRAFT_249152 [Aspergillus undulatus]|uniref:uncharacterized protein n=1 Tax=Aspergillus undulatus TaxID=1810928 RepID=UPI003CCDCBB8
MKMLLKLSPKTALLALTTTALGQNICTPGSIGVGIAPDTATSTYSLIVNNTCGLIDSRVGHGELCGLYNGGSEVDCLNGVEGTVESVNTPDGEYGTCVRVNEVCYVTPGYAIQWCCSE